MGKVEYKNCLLNALREKGRNFDFLLDLKFTGNLLPFRECLDKMKENNVSTEGLFAKKTGENIWHISTEEGIPLNQVFPLEKDLVGLDPIITASLIGGTAMLGGAAMQTFGGKKGIEQKIFDPPERAAGRQMLLDYLRGRGVPGYTFGEQYQGDLGAYELTGLEKKGQERVGRFIDSDDPEGFQLASGEVRDILSGTRYDPYDPKGLYGGFAEEVDIAGQEASDELKRQMAFGGGLHSSATAREMGRIGERTGQLKANKLAELYDTYVQRRMNTIPLAMELSRMADEREMGKMSAAHTYGALQRTLEDQKAKDLYSEWVRARNEGITMPLQIATTLSGSTQNFGIPSIPTENPWAKMLDTALQSGAYIYGLNAGRKAGVEPRTTPTFNLNPETRNFRTLNQPYSYADLVREG